jgi:hypothetical protein
MFTLLNDELLIPITIPAVVLVERAFTTLFGMVRLPTTLLEIVEGEPLEL